MKKLIITILAIMLFSGTLIAEGLSKKGVKIGLNLSTIRISDNENADDINDMYKTKFGGSIGGFVTIDINEQLSVQPEIYYTMKGTDIELEIMNHTFKGSMTLNYIEVPILVVFKLQPGIGLYGGPSLSYFLNGTTTNEDEDGKEKTEDIDKDEISVYDLGLVVGGSYTLPEGISIDLRYTLGLLNVNDESKNDKSTINNHLFQLMVGYSF